MQTDVPMLLDTGADATLVPESFVKKLDVDFALTEQYKLAGFNDQKSVSHLVHLHLIFERLTFRGDYFLINQNYGIIGRNVLNLLNINFDGKNGNGKFCKSPLNQMSELDIKDSVLQPSSFQITFIFFRRLKTMRTMKCQVCFFTGMLLLALLAYASSGSGV